MADMEKMFPVYIEKGNTSEFGSVGNVLHEFKAFMIECLI